MPVFKTFLICTLASGCIMQSNVAVAFCSKPITPHCVEDESLTDAYVSEERCRRALEDHVEDLTSYRQCLTVEVDRIEATIEQFQKLLGDSGTKSRNLPTIPGDPGAPLAAQAAG